MNLSSWFRNITSPKISQPFSFFYSLKEGFSNSKISDKEAISTGLLSSAAWYTIAETAAKGISSLPLRLGEIDSSGEVKPITTGEVHEAIFYPNEDQTLSELWELNALYFLTNGEFYEYLDRDSVGFMGGKMISLPPELMTVNTDVDSSIISNVQSYTFQDANKEYTLLPDDVLHVKLSNPSVTGRQNHNGLSPLNAGMNMLNAGNNIETALGWYFENRGVSNLIAGESKDGVSMTTSQKNALEAATNSRLGGAHKMNSNLITQAPISNVYNLAASSTDMQMLENYNLVLRRLCSLIGLPSILVNDNEQSTYNNVIEAKKQAYTEVYIPLAQKFIRGYERKWLKDWDKRTGKKHVLYIDRQEIEAFQMTPEEKIDQAIRLVERGIWTRNEARPLTNKEELPITDMDVPTIQSNLVPVQNLGNNE